MRNNVNYKVITLRVSEEEREALHAESVEFNVSLNALIRRKLGLSDTISGRHYNTRPMTKEQRSQMNTRTQKPKQDLIEQITDQVKKGGA